MSIKRCEVCEHNYDTDMQPECDCQIVITCQVCGLDYEEEDVNIIDYPIDTCSNCEQKLMNNYIDNLYKI